MAAVPFPEGTASRNTVRPGVYRHAGFPTTRTVITDASVCLQAALQQNFLYLPLPASWSGALAPGTAASGGVAKPSSWDGVESVVVVLLDEALTLVTAFHGYDSHRHILRLFLPYDARSEIAAAATARNAVEHRRAYQTAEPRTPAVGASAAAVARPSRPPSLPADTPSATLERVAALANDARVVSRSQCSLQVQYNQTTFRSRLEASHAVFFDALNERYLYEPQKFMLRPDAGVDRLIYTPDFFLPRLQMYLEIKPLRPNFAAMQKAALLAQWLGPRRSVVLLFGSRFGVGTTGTPDYTYRYADRVAAMVWRGGEARPGFAYWALSPPATTTESAVRTPCGDDDQGGNDDDDDVRRGTASRLYLQQVTGYEPSFGPLEPRLHAPRLLRAFALADAFRPMPVTPPRKA